MVSADLRSVSSFSSLLTLLLAACAGGAQMVAAPVGPPIDIAPLPSPSSSSSSSTSDPDTTTSGGRFPGGPGVTLTVDDLNDASQSSTLRGLANTITFDERVATAKRLLGGAEGDADPATGGVAFRGVSSRNIAGPYGCYELLIAPASPFATVRPADPKHCGLPYNENTTRHPPTVYTGAAPRRTITRMKQYATELAQAAAQGNGSNSQAMLIAKRKLGIPDKTDATSTEWFAIGGRDANAPITCHVLRVVENAGQAAKVQIEQRELDQCGLSWPPPASAFDSGPRATPVSESIALAECAAKCNATSEVCMVDRRVPLGASIMSGGTGGTGTMTARFLDGRPAQMELVSSCIPIPATCAKLESSCFFPRALPPPAPPPPPGTNAGPCPRATFSGYSFATFPKPHITCYSRVVPSPPKP